MRPALRQARTLLNHDALHAAVPTFLCPALLRTPAPTPRRHPRPTQRFSTVGRAQQDAAAPLPAAADSERQPVNAPVPVPANSTLPEQRTLPRACPGCGAPSQLVDRDEAGYYNVDRGAVRAYLRRPPSRPHEATQEDDVYSKALEKAHANPELLKELGVLDADTTITTTSTTTITAPTATTTTSTSTTEAPQPDTPVCDRCHNLIHHSIGSPIHHPTVDSIQQTIAESPHRRNHIYHVVDAADFPLSIVPNLQSSLRIPKLRTQNRRAKHKGWVANDRIAEVSFIVTRADLLAPKKEQVDSLMPYITAVLRDALGRDNNKARLGNVRLVSAKRGWWTKQVKEEIWDRGGAGWMVGKVNVGKSNLFEAVFPKGRGADYQDVRKIRTAAEREAMLNAATSLEDLARVQKQLADEDAEIERYNNRPKQHVHQPPRALEREPEEEEEDDEEDPDALLPPPQPYTAYPVLPIASSLPGTTASPIRIPFGKNRGELIDLPGLARTSPGLETFVQPAHQQDLIMTSRLNAERLTLKPGQSLIIGGGLVRITPLTDDLIFLIHPFVPIHAHVTRTEKAADYQSQTSDRQLQVAPILAPGVGPQMRSAGRFALRWDVTKKLAGPLTSSVAGKMKPENLPFRVWSTDILLEGVGWVEVSAQTRRPQGWKPIGLRKKDPNHAKQERERRLREEKEHKDLKFSAIAQAQAAGEDVEDALSRAFAGDAAAKQERAREAGGAANADADGDEMADWQHVYPEIEVFSPLGRFVGARRPMCASTVMGPKSVSSRERVARPRRSMKSVKRQRAPAGKE